MHRRFKPGDRVVFHKTKQSNHPGPRARYIHPAPQGEGYTYEVDKYWIVVDARPNGQVGIRTRRGKMLILDMDDPNLRHATWWERLMHSRRFPAVEEQLSGRSQPA
jgi:hypothetical protein